VYIVLLAEAVVAARGDGAGDFPLSVRDVCEERFAGGVADTEDVPVGGPHSGVGVDIPIFRAFHVGVVQLQPLGVSRGVTPRGDDDVLP